MTPEEMRVAIAEACGWKHNFCERGDGMEVSIWRDSTDVIRPLPKLTLDLMHEAMKVVFGKRRGYYERAFITELCGVLGMD